MDPVSIFLQGNEGIVRSAVSDCIACCDEKTFIAAGCEIPKHTPHENLITMDKMLYR